MAEKYKSKALPLTITLGSILLFFCLVLVTLWNIVLVYNYSQLKQYAGPLVAYSSAFQWIVLGVGCFFFVVIITGVTLFMVFLAKQIILNQTQKNFIDSVTHELKTPLTSLKLYIETLKKHDLPQQKKDDFLNIMLKDIERLDVLVNHILDAAKMEHIYKSYKIKEVDLEQILEFCVEVIINRYNLENGVFVINLEKTRVYSDPYALQLVFMNLLDNAVKYSGEDSKIIIDSKTEKDERLIITVSDNGYGIPREKLKKVFGRFYRAVEHIKDSKKGSGLGLFIVKETVRSLKGKITVHSDGLNKGSIFKIVLPNKEYDKAVTD